MKIEMKAKVNVRIPDEQRGDALARAEQLAVEGWYENATDHIDALMAEFMPGWSMTKVEVQLPLESRLTFYRCTLTVSDGRERQKLYGEGDTAYTAMLGAIVGAVIVDRGDDSP